MDGGGSALDTQRHQSPGRAGDYVWLPGPAECWALEGKGKQEGEKVNCKAVATEGSDYSVGTLGLG